MTLPVSKSGFKRSFGEPQHSCEIYLCSLARTTTNEEGKTGEDKKMSALEAKGEQHNPSKMENLMQRIREWHRHKTSICEQTHQGHLTPAGGLFPLRLSHVWRDNFSPKWENSTTALQGGPEKQKRERVQEPQGSEGARTCLKEV